MAQRVASSVLFSKDFHTSLKIVMSNIETRPLLQVSTNQKTTEDTQVLPDEFPLIGLNPNPFSFLQMGHPVYRRRMAVHQSSHVPRRHRGPFIFQPKLHVLAAATTSGRCAEKVVPGSGRVEIAVVFVVAVTEVELDVFEE